MNTHYTVCSVPLDDGTEAWRSRVFTPDWHCIFTTYDGMRATGVAACKHAIDEHKRRMATAAAEKDTVVVL
jgi:hypothetical protein